MDIPQKFCVRWNSYKSNLQTAFPKLLTSEHFVDVTLACEKQFIKCHKIVLSACSTYFETLLINNPCQHPIIFMKDVQFWEIKALVEFMYKGEVNVSHNQLDSLLKSAESLQIRGLSGTKQFINFDHSEEILDPSSEVRDESKTKKTKCHNEEVEEECPKKRKRKNEDEKSVQLASVKGIEESQGDKKNENNVEAAQPPKKLVKEETTEQEFEFENSCEMTAEDEEAEIFLRHIFYPVENNDAGPSGIPDLCSLALNNVECVMDQEKTKAMSSSLSPPPPPNSSKNSLKSLQRHHEHNYTNLTVDETSVTITKVNTGSEQGCTTNERESMRIRSKTNKTESGENNQKPPAVKPSSATQSEKPVEVKNKVIKKDVFNRIRRSEEELQKAAEMVRGGMTFQTASDTFNIPISTIRFYMARRGILPQRRRGRGSSGVRDDDLIHPPFEIIHYRLPDIDKPI